MGSESKNFNLSLPFDEDSDLFYLSSGTSNIDVADALKKKKQITFKNEVQFGSDAGSIDVEKENESSMSSPNKNDRTSQNKQGKLLIGSPGSSSTPILGRSRINDGIVLKEEQSRRPQRRPKSEGGRLYSPIRSSTSCEFYDEPFPKSLQKYEPISLSACKRSLPTLQEYSYYDPNFVSPLVGLSLAQSEPSLSATRILLDKLDGVYQCEPTFADDDEIEKDNSPGNPEKFDSKRMNKSSPNLIEDMSEEESQSDNEGPSYPVISKFNCSQCSPNHPKIEDAVEDLEDAVAVNMNISNTA